MVDSIRPISDIENMPVAVQQPKPAVIEAGQKLYLKLPERTAENMRRIELLLKMFPGEQQMVIWCEREKKRIGAKCLLHEALIAELGELYGEENIVIK